MASCALSGDRENLVSAGCDAYIEKNIDPERVMEQLGAILKRTK